MHQQTKNHRDQMDVEIGKAKVLQSELIRAKDENRILESTFEEFKYQIYGGKRTHKTSAASRANRSIPIGWVVVRFVGNHRAVPRGSYLGTNVYLFTWY